MNKAELFLDMVEDEKTVDLKQLAKLFIMENPNPPDSVLHDYCDKLGISPHDFETAIYALLTDYIKKEG